MREISCQEIESAVSRLCRQANVHLPHDVRQALQKAQETEKSPAGQAVLADLAENARLAAEKELPICQDTGMAVVFVEVGQEVRLHGGDLQEAISAGVATGYRQGYLRNSVVCDPLQRDNTGDNTPPVIHHQIVPGDRLQLTVAPKGFGSENMSAARMLSPAEGREGLKQFVLETMLKAGPNPCPPVIIGLGLGGTLEKAALLAKRALLRPINQPHPQGSIERLEKELLTAVNETGIGPGGLGGLTTALGLNIETYPTHIAGLPAVLNMSCHATRHASVLL